MRMRGAPPARGEANEIVSYHINSDSNFLFRRGFDMMRDGLASLSL